MTPVSVAAAAESPVLRPIKNSNEDGTLRRPERSSLASYSLASRAVPPRRSKPRAPRKRSLPCARNGNANASAKMTMGGARQMRRVGLTRKPDRQESPNRSQQCPPRVYAKIRPRVGDRGHTRRACRVDALAEGCTRGDELQGYGCARPRALILSHLTRPASTPALMMACLPPAGLLSRCYARALGGGGNGGVQ